MNRGMRSLVGAISSTSLSNMSTRLQLSSLARKTRSMPRTPAVAAAPFTTAAAAASTAHNNNDNKNSVGLFSIPGLHQPHDFQRLALEAVQESDRLRETIPQTLTSKHHAVETLYQLDKISQTVCNVIDAAELCRSTHASEEWRAVANQSFQELQQYIATLNGDQRLHQALVAVDRDYQDQLTEEESRFCFLLKREFELDGIHLPDKERAHVGDLHHQVVEAETAWMSNITHSRNPFWTQKDPVESVIPRHVLQANGAHYTSDRPEEVQLLADSPIANSISNFSPNGSLRKEVYMASMTSTPENREVLEAMRHRRHELATALGFESYANRALQDKMAQTPQTVLTFLDDLQAQIQPQFHADLEVIRRAKSQVEGDTATTGSVEPWDIKFYSKLIKTQLGVDSNELAPYLGLTNCLNAMQVLVERLFGIEMQEAPMAPGESWDMANPSETLAPDQKIRKFLFHDKETQQPLGTMYLDLHPREGKYTHAAHFTVRCGCRVNAPDDPNPEYQLPIVALVCNMNTGNATLTSHSEVETLFHEMGHALHSLLSRTNFQHMSGTRAAMDFVETPSHWMEHYVWDPDFLSILCQSPQTGETIPDAMKQALVSNRNLFKCLEMQSQIVLSRFDQGLFGIPQPNHSQEHTQQLWTNLHDQVGLPFLPGTHWYTNVGHFVTYGAGYYGYLYSQVFANAIWKEDFDRKRSLDNKAGNKIWKGLLQHGGARDPQIMLHEFLGKKPTAGTYLSNLNSS